MREEMTWNERVAHIILKSKNNKHGFKDWLLSKEYMKGQYFDYFMYSRLFNIYKSLTQEDRDHFIVVSGKEGSGKSTLALQIASVLDPKFNLNNVFFKINAFVAALRTAQIGDTFVLDEGNLFIFSRESMKDENKLMLKLFAIMRQKRLCIIINVPNFFTLDTYVRDHRADMLVYVHQRGKYVSFVK